MVKDDIETGKNQNQRQLYTGMMQSPQIRWAFIRKVYIIMSMQLLLTVGVVTAVVMVKPIARFMIHKTLGIVVYFCISVFAMLTTLALFFLRKRHPWNYLLLILVTISLAFPMGILCTVSKGEIILEAAILTCVATTGLTLYTFWAVRRSKDFSFLGPFLLAAFLILLAFGIIQIVWPQGKLSHMLYGCLGALVFSAHIIFDTNNLIKRFDCDDYIWPAVQIYLDILNIFLSSVTILRVGQ